MMKNIAKFYINYWLNYKFNCLKKKKKKNFNLYTI